MGTAPFILGKILIIHKMCVCVCVCVSYKLAPTLKLFKT